MKYQICIFSANYLPNLGGVERYTFNLAKKLTAAGCEVTVVTSNTFSLEEQETADGIHIVRMPCFNVLGGRFPVLKPNARFRALKRQLQSTPFDYVIVNTRFYLHSLFGVRFAHKRGIPCLTIEHGTAHFTVNSAVFDKLGHVYEHWVTSRVKKHCRAFYGVSEACCDWLQHFGIEPKGVLYNAVDYEHIRQLMAENAKDYRKEYAVSENATIVTYTGRIVREKGIFRLAEAAMACSQPLHLFIAGDGPEMDALRELCASADNITLLGMLPFEEVAGLLAQSDVYCLPSEAEGFPTSVLEAVAADCFVITTRFGGAKELITSKEYGIVLNESDTALIRGALEEALADDTYRQTAANRCRERLIEHFTWDVTAQNVLHIVKGDTV